MHRIGWFLALFVFVNSGVVSLADSPPKGFKSLFNGKDLTGWKVPDKDNHWKVVKGVIDYNAKGRDPLWTKDSFGDFILRVDWRLKPEKGMLHRVPYIEPDGSYRTDKKGRKIEILLNDVDSGIYLRGRPKSQVNIWCWPVGSGEVWGYRTDKKMSKEVRAGVTPKKQADKPVGEWNTFEIKMIGDRLWVKLNDVEVITKAKLPGVPASGPIALQHHGRWSEKEGRWVSPPSLVQFRNIYVKELK
ncbi:MAG: DUF1080 domain-containing protein [Gemmataceae bacterium]